MPRTENEWTDEQLVDELPQAARDGYGGTVQRIQIELMRRLGHPEYTPPKEDADV